MESAVLKALVLTSLGGFVSGRMIRNGWLAILLMIGLVGSETTYEAIQRHWKPLKDIEAFSALDTTGSAAVLLGEILAI